MGSVVEVGSTGHWWWVPVSDDNPRALKVAKEADKEWEDRVSQMPLVERWVSADGEGQPEG